MSKRKGFERIVIYDKSKDQPPPVGITLNEIEDVDMSHLFQQPAKPKATWLNIRLSPEEKQLLEQAAVANRSLPDGQRLSTYRPWGGDGASAWLRALGLREAERLLRPAEVKGSKRVRR